MSDHPFVQTDKPRLISQAPLCLPAYVHGTDDPMANQLVLSLFSGADLFGRAFQAHGAVVVSAGDILLGRDIRDFHARPGMFDGVIGGPPCQFASSAALTGTRAVNLIPEFLRIVDETKPQWAIMENVPEAAPFAPAWPGTILEDFNCGGLTWRARSFWFCGVPACPVPAYREGKREYSVLATSWNNRGQRQIESIKLFSGHTHLTANQAAYLQGYPELGYQIVTALPSRDMKHGVNAAGRQTLAVHMLGNGVPAAMANYVAGHVAYWLRHGEMFAPVQMPMFVAFAPPP